MSKDYIILLASNGNNIGKSTTAKLFKEYLDKYTYANTHILSFAEPIRQQVDLLYSSCIHGSNKGPLSFKDMYTQEDKNTLLSNVFSNNDLAFAPKLKNKSVRLLVNEYSDLIQEFISPQVWAHSAYLSILNKVDNNSDYSCNVFIFDDFRREIEYNYLKEQLPSFKFITIYLDKEGDKDQVTTSYEGRLKDFDFTHKFTFDNEYNNFNNLVDLVLNDIDYKEVVVNKCYGGFGISAKAIELYLTTKYGSFKKEKSLENGFIYYSLPDGESFYNITIERDDPVLVQVVKQLKEDSWGDYSQLKIVKIPSKVDFVINDYDGHETICESYKTFG